MTVILALVARIHECGLAGLLRQPDHELFLAGGGWLGRRRARPAAPAHGCLLRPSSSRSSRGPTKNCRRRRLIKTWMAATPAAMTKVGLQPLSPVILALVARIYGCGLAGLRRQPDHKLFLAGGGWLGRRRARPAAPAHGCLLRPSSSRSSRGPTKNCRRRRLIKTWMAATPAAMTKVGLQPLSPVILAPVARIYGCGLAGLLRQPDHELFLAGGG
ncbi:MAG: hypothetical protein U0S49_01370 [Rhodospirillales bacterium]|nr:hypothetical protein [Rhodospirillales bacterium]